VRNMASILILATALSSSQGSSARESFGSSRSTQSESAISDDEIRDLLLPMPAAATRPFPAKREWIATVRIRPDDKPEFWAVLEKEYGAEAHAVAVFIKSQPIRTQLEALPISAQRESAAQIAPRVATGRWESSDTRCRPLAAVAHDVGMLRVPVLTSDALVLHSTMYEAVFETRNSRLAYSISVAASMSAEYPMVQWVNRLQRAIGKCSGFDAK
jgi:hypothetical protein